MADQHTVRAYDKDLDLLERRIAEMGGLAEKMVIEAVDALASGDAALANRLTAVAGPKVFTSRERRFSSLCFGTIKVPQSSEVASGEAREHGGSLFSNGGTALVIHAKADDMATDPSGNSGGRIACGVFSSM